MFTKNFNKYIPYEPGDYCEGAYPIPFYIWKSSSSVPMVLCLKTQNSRTLPDIK